MRRTARAAASAVSLALAAGLAEARPPPPSEPADWRLYPLHDESDGLAVSPDGRLVVSASMHEPANAFRVFDLAHGTAWRLVHPERRIVLSDPAFSPDGRSIAFVVGRPGRTRESEIWVVDLDGGDPRRLGELGRAYRHPAFSPDGDRLAYFRDVDPPAQGDPRGSLDGLPARAYAMFEAGLASGNETRLAERRFRIPCGLAYHRKDDGFYFCALHPLLDPGATPEGLFEGDPDGVEQIAYERRTGFAHNFSFRRGEEVPLWPEPIAPGQGATWSAALMGVAADGRPMLFATDPHPFPIPGRITYRFMAYSPEGSTAVEAKVDPENCSPFAAGGGGRVIAAETHCATQGSDGGVHPTPSKLTLVRDGKLSLLPTQSFRFEPQPRVMTPPPGSIFTGHP